VIEAHRRPTSQRVTLAGRFEWIAFFASSILPTGVAADELDAVDSESSSTPIDFSTGSTRQSGSRTLINASSER
jgi:hypothetical protein